MFSLFLAYYFIMIFHDYDYVENFLRRWWGLRARNFCDEFKEFCCNVLISLITIFMRNKLLFIHIWDGFEKCDAPLYVKTLIYFWNSYAGKTGCYTNQLTSLQKRDTLEQRYHLLAFYEFWLMVMGIKICWGWCKLCLRVRHLYQMMLMRMTIGRLNLT